MKTNQAIVFVLGMMLLSFAACDHRHHVIRHYHVHVR